MTTESVALIPMEPDAVQLGTLRADNPAALLKAAESIATPLAKLIKDRKLYSTISGRDFVRCEGWTTLAAMLGCTPHEVSVVETEGSFTATVELRRMGDGQSVARASAECGTDEPTWKARPRYARRSMALTRATGKAARLAFSWVMVLAGFEATPAEEIPSEPEEDRVRLPGKPSSWDGYGGKPLEDVPSEVLAKARKWLHDKDAQKNAALVGQIDDELESRRDEGTDPLDP